ncbi:Holliday junction resolvase [Candidatus Woesearchaeota archaeon]|nr:Holliday junction resolvase [Candidatus Woesearchaeota archaeon]
MSRKSKGTNAERELIHLFWSVQGWAAIRVAGSGSSQYPCPDIVAGNKHRKLAIECKAVKGDSKYLSKTEIGQLIEYCERFAAEPWVGIRFNNEKWFFLMIEDLLVSQKHYIITRELVKLKGLLFEELVS